MVRVLGWRALKNLYNRCRHSMALFSTAGTGASFQHRGSIANSQFRTKEFSYKEIEIKRDRAPESVKMAPRRQKHNLNESQGQHYIMIIFGAFFPERWSLTIP